LFFLVRLLPSPPPRPTLFPYTTLFRSWRSVSAVQARTLAGNDSAASTWVKSDHTRSASMTLDPGIRARASVTHPVPGRAREPVQERNRTSVNSSHQISAYRVFRLTITQ